MSTDCVGAYQVISWNIGRDSDYLGLNVRNKDVQWKNMQELGLLRNQLFTDVFKDMRDSKKPDFFCLQEVSRSGDIQKWLGDGYGVHTASRDCVIAWDLDKYELIEGTPETEKREGRFLVLQLLERSTRKTIYVASAHLWGFKLTEPKGKEAGTNIGVTEKGDAQLKEMAAHLTNSDYLSIIGMDANTTPDIHPDRLSILESEGFRRDPSKDGLPTAYNSSLESNSAHLDYLFAKGSKKHQLQLEATFFEALPIESPAVNPSDHSPVALSIKVMKQKKKSGFLSKLVSGMRSEKQ